MAALNDVSDDGFGGDDVNVSDDAQASPQLEISLANEMKG